MEVGRTLSFTLRFMFRDENPFACFLAEVKLTCFCSSSPRDRSFHGNENVESTDQSIHQFH